jgi:hypothetical protein
MFENENLVVDPIMLSATRRVVVRQDKYPELPDVDGFGMFPVYQNNHYVTLPAGNDSETSGELRDVFNIRYDFVSDDVIEKVESVLNRRGVVWRRNAFTDYRDFVGDYYVWANYPDATVDHVNAWIKEVQMFIDGEVYEVAVETLRVYRDDSDPERTFERWEVDEAVCGIYFDPSNTAAVMEVANDMEGVNV